MKRVLILHGWGADSNSNWFPWLKKELEKKRIIVYSPNLPKSDFPVQNEWLKEIQDQVRIFDENLSIVGHSLGAVAILRILETFSQNEKIDNAVLVSGFVNNPGIPEISDFFKTEFDWKKIKKAANNFIVINSDNDPFIPLEQGKKLKEYLNAEFIIEHNAGHINLGDGFFKYQRILDYWNKNWR